MVFCDPKGYGAAEVALPLPRVQIYVYRIYIQDYVYDKEIILLKKQKPTSLGDESGVMPYYFRRIRCNEGRKPKLFDMNMQGYRKYLEGSNLHRI